MNYRPASVSRAVMAPDCVTQARQALDALEQILAQAGASLETVIEAFLLDPGDFKA